MTVKPSPQVEHVSQTTSVSTSPPHLPLNRSFSSQSHNRRTKHPRKRQSFTSATKSRLQQTSSSEDTSSSEQENYDDGVVSATRKSREAMWSKLKALVPLSPATSQQVASAWDAILRRQQAYAVVHGKVPGTAMKSSSLISLLGRTIGMMTRYAPHMGKPPPHWKATLKQLGYLARRDKHLVKRATPATWDQILQIIWWLEQRGEPTAALFLHLLWLAAARGTSIQKLQAANVFANHLPVPRGTPSWTGRRCLSDL